MQLPVFTIPQHPLEPISIGSYALLGLSILSMAYFWIWALVHAVRTPRAPWTQRLLWGFYLFLNPTATIWYWCVWKRWAFWTLFTPLLGFFMALPFAVRSVMTKADATNLTNSLFALGSNGLVIFFAILLIFPVVLRLAVTLNMTVNSALSAMDRNDWVLSVSFPVIGFGAALAYATRHMRPWAFIGMGWLVVLIIVGRIMVWNVGQLLVPAGEEKRENYKILQHP